MNSYGGKGVPEKLVAKQKEQTKEGQGNKPNAGRMLTEEEIDILEGQSLLGCSCSWLNDSQHGDMRLGDVERTTTADVVAFRSATNDKDQRQSKRRSCCKAKYFCSRRQWKSCQDSYASKRPDKMKTPQSPLYFAINYTTKAVKKKPGSNQLLWEFINSTHLWQ